MVKDIRITDLIKFGKNGLQMFDEYLEEKKIEPQERVYIQHSTTDLEISERNIKRSESASTAGLR